MEASNPDVVIRELDECLSADPPPDLAMYAYFNLSAAIWEKFQFKDRKGANIADDEYVWVLGCNLCIRRVLEIYEKLPRAQQLEGDVVKVHHGAKQHLDLTMMYGSMVYRYGRRDFHDVHGLPPVRALNAPLAIAQCSLAISPSILPPQFLQDIVAWNFRFLSQKCN